MGYACRSISRERTFFEKLGFAAEGETFTDPLQKITGLFLCLGSYRVELLEPLNTESPLLGYLAKAQNMYHQGFAVADFDGALSALQQQQGAMVVSAPQPAVAFNNRRVCFLMLRSMMLIELIES